MDQQAISVQIERAASNDWLNTCLSAPAYVVAETGLTIQRFGSAWASVMPTQKDYPVNGTNGVGLFEPATESLLDDLTAFFRSHGCDSVGVSITPATLPDSLADMLLQRGFTQGGRIPILYRDATIPIERDLPEGLTIKRMKSVDAAQWGELFGRMYVGYLARWQQALVGEANRFHYLVLDGDTPVAAAQMTVTDRVGFLHFSGVLPEHRGRGIQRALIARRIGDAQAAGCQWVSSTADEDTPEEPGYSIRNLQACGFAVLHYSRGYGLSLSDKSITIS